jgi:hypothetical protein
MAWAAGWVLVAGHGLAVLPGCDGPGRSDEQLAQELGAALAALIPEGVAPTASPERTVTQAARALVEGLSQSEVGGLLAAPAALRAHLRERGRADLSAGRSDWVEGWLLSRTELDAALLAESGR